MKIILIGGIIPAQKEDYYYRNSTKSIQIAANSWQNNVLNGIEKILGTVVDVINAPFIPHFSHRYSLAYHHGYAWEHSKGANDTVIDFCNIFPYKNFSRYWHLRSVFKKWLKQNRDEEKVVLLYSPHVPFFKVAKMAQKARAKVVGIIPDLPEYTGNARMGEPLYRMLKKYDVKALYRSAKNVDGFVYLTEYMKEKFPAKPYTVVECIADPALANYEETVTNIKKVVYTGTLQKYYGIDSLIKSFDYINNDSIELHICGDGPMKAEIEKLSETCKKLYFHGNVSRAEAIALQRSATLLINPRDNEGDYTKYSFPSKTLEYMLAAKPVLCHKLQGIPQEYDDFLIYLESNEPKDLAKSILKICALPIENRVAIGNATRDFAENRKNYVTQTKKILDLIRTL